MDRPDLTRELALLESGVPAVIGVDEVGRGAAAGPVCCAAVVIDATTGPAPEGIRDSKQLTPRRREQLAEEISRWVRHGLGWASAAEVDDLGILAALGVAAKRAVQATGCAGVVLLDGDRDYLGDREVVVSVGGDRRHLSVAAASILAKTARDALMVEMDHSHPGYGWVRNKGYWSAEHRQAVERLGWTVEHRRSWNLG
jgi:ribonuclease HII